MGSKRWQLGNGLGTQLQRVVKPGERFIDLFSGSGAVSWFAATELQAEVTSVDLQAYAVALSGAVVERTKAINADRLVESWLGPIRKMATQFDDGTEERLLEAGLTAQGVGEIRRIASESDELFVRSYSGHYYSLAQGRHLGLLRATLPARRPDSTVCLAALVTAASRCSASPGHTAQPFQPTKKALPFISSIWQRDFVDEVEVALRSLATRHAAHRGRAVEANANDFARNRLRGGEVVFLDPPYSAAQYSRFYHVLEAVAVGGYAEVSGAGRSPSLSQRKRSDYSCVSAAKRSLTELLAVLASNDCRVIATFPQYQASNGLSGQDIVDSARGHFHVDTSISSATFSTLGGNGEARSARHQSHELVITMFPRT